MKPVGLRVAGALWAGIAAACALLIGLGRYGSGVVIAQIDSDATGPDATHTGGLLISAVHVGLPEWGGQDEAFQIANSTDYALTGGFYSRSPANLDRARQEMIVGNLYLNRNITGALVGRQPFGGFKLSGIGSKAGGPDYLLQFVIPRTITENTMRRGFAPES